MTDGNFPVVLTADRTLMAAYTLLLDGMGAASQTTFTPSPVMKGLIAPRVACDGLRARQAPLGLRRIEAALRQGGWAAEDVAIVPPERLRRAIGPRTRVVGLASGDPLGLGMNSTTMVGVFGGKPYTSTMFLALLKDVRRLVNEHCPAARVVAGGPGMWQLAGEGGEETARKSGLRLGRAQSVSIEEAHFGPGTAGASKCGTRIDHVITGYCESNVADLFRRMADGADLPVFLEGSWQRGDEVPRIVGATVMGMVEASRGCGWGCRFCTLAHQPMAHLPVETIASDVETNFGAGVDNISLGSEDIFRYGAAGGARAAPQKLIDLLRTLRELRGLRTLSVDHANVVTVAAFSDAQLAEVHELLAGSAVGHLVWLNLGVETACGELLAANDGAAKIKPYSPDEWGELCLEQVRRLCRQGFFPLVSLVIGLPGETPPQTERTRCWVESLRDERVSVVPVLHTPVGGEGGHRIAAGEVSAKQWEIFERGLDLTFRWMPQLYWRHHGLAGVAPWRRVMMQIFGRFYAPLWKHLVHRRKAAAR
jgi:radical SAM superfamily enzyme YgiQ (UPF0313 family)